MNYQKRLYIRTLLNERIERQLQPPVLLTHRIKQTIYASLIEHLIITGFVTTEAEINETNTIAQSRLDLHQQLQLVYGLNYPPHRPPPADFQIRRFD